MSTEIEQQRMKSQKFVRKAQRTDSQRSCKYSNHDFCDQSMIKLKLSKHQSLFTSNLDEEHKQNEQDLLHIKKKESQQNISQIPQVIEEKEFECGCKPSVIPFEKNDSWQILLVGKLNDPEVFPVFSQVIKQFKDKQCTFYVENHSLQKFKDQLIKDQLSEFVDALTEFNSQNHESIIDIIVTLGGDGTILYTMSHFQNRYSPPIIAIEKGTLGFMCMYNIQNIEKDIQKILQNVKVNRNLMVERKMRIHVKILDDKGNIAKQNGVEKSYHALNEIVIDRGPNASCLKMEIFLNNEPLTKTLGDGLIFSTPTGSTAYSLSAGGPIIQNEVRSISLVPICPFSLSFRPIVLPECSELKVKLTEDNRGQGKVSGDGQKIFDLLPGEIVHIESSDLDVYVVRETFKANNVHEWMVKLKKMLNWNSNFSK
ncbi:hypothetical protein ABPG72_022001 [Tetrahymena utriculariae]